MMWTVTPLHYLSIEVSPEGIGEREYGRRVVFVPASEIQSIAEAHGFVGERPVLLFLFGSTLLLLALLVSTWFYWGTRPEYMAETGPFQMGSKILTGTVMLTAFGI